MSFFSCDLRYILFTTFQHTNLIFEYWYIVKEFSEIGHLPLSKNEQDCLPSSEYIKSVLTQKNDLSFN